MDINKEIKKLEEQFTYSECVKLAISIIRGINSISPEAFDEWTDSPKNITEDSKEKKMFY